MGVDGHNFAFSEAPSGDSVSDSACNAPCADGGSYKCGCADAACGGAAPAPGEELVRRWVVYELPVRPCQLPRRSERLCSHVACRRAMHRRRGAREMQRRRRSGRKRRRRANRTFKMHLCRSPSGAEHLLAEIDADAHSPRRESPQHQHWHSCATGRGSVGRCSAAVTHHLLGLCASCGGRRARGRRDRWKIASAIGVCTRGGIRGRSGERRLRPHRHPRRHPRRRRRRGRQRTKPPWPPRSGSSAAHTAAFAAASCLNRSALRRFAESCAGWRGPTSCPI